MEVDGCAGEKGDCVVFLHQLFYDKVSLVKEHVPRTGPTGFHP